MKNYVLADVYRLMRRRPRIVLLILIYIITLIGMNFTRGQLTWNSVAFIGSYEIIFGMAGIAVCLLEFLFVYASDFKARIMQVAIGRGLSRPQVVLSKFIEVAIMDVISLGILWILILIYGAVTGIRLSGTQGFEMAVVFVTDMFSELIVTGLVAIFLFLFQNAGVSALVYAAVSCDPMQYVYRIFSEKFKIIVSLHLQDLCFSALCERFKSHLILGQFNFPALLGIACYILIGYFVTVAIFKRRELDF